LQRIHQKFYTTEKAVYKQLSESFMNMFGGSLRSPPNGAAYIPLLASRSDAEQAYGTVTFGAPHTPPH